MRVDQRAVKSQEAFEPTERLWHPYTLQGPEGTETAFAALPDDRYAVVDDVYDGFVVFVVSSWPHLDREGRLTWKSAPAELTIPLASAQPLIDGFRAQLGITAPDRPLRVGDAFLLRGGGGEEGLEAAAPIVDVSAAAREAAKAALFGAAASTLEPEYADRIGIDRPYEEPIETAGSFDVRQNAARAGGSEAEA